MPAAGESLFDVAWFWAGTLNLESLAARLCGLNPDAYPLWTPASSSREWEDYYLPVDDVSVDPIFLPSLYS